jgi:arsenate reductase-like glutaredoxin family protein
MAYILYTQNFCSACDQIIDHLKCAGLKFNVVNIDEKPNACPEELFIIPALSRNTLLKAYGKDIIKVIHA